MAPSQITPTPSDEETAAITAAVEALWPKPLGMVADDQPRPLAWRFSGRWWQRDRFAKSDRPWG